MSAETAAVLRKARALIDTPQKWARGRHAQDINGRPVSPLSAEAVCFCVDGAIYRTATPVWGSPLRLLFKPYTNARAALVKEIPSGQAIEGWNDAPERTHDQVMAAFDAAIAAEEATP